MPSKIIERILKKVDSPDLIELLSDKLSPSELQALLLYVFERQARQKNPAGLLRNYLENRFVTPATLDAKKALEFSLLAFQEASAFEALELAPVGPTGTCSVLGTVHQNKVISALRNTEVLADSTNMMALEAAAERQGMLKTNPKDTTIIRFCSSHRLVRAQYFESSTHTPHFRVFAMLSAGRDLGHFKFEISELLQHFNVYLKLMRAAEGMDLFAKAIKIGITPLQTSIDRAKLQEQLFKPIQKDFPEVNIYFNDARENGRNYYQTICFNIDVENKEGAILNLGDGGFTNWTQALLNNKKERLLISGFGAELFCKLF